MPDLPGEAVRAAHAAYANALYDRPDPTVLSDETLMRIVLEAAAPAMAGHAEQKIRAHMGAHGPRSRRLRRSWRRHFDIAARITATAFMTDDDMRRAAAEALSRMRSWPPPEHGNPVAGERED